MGLFWIFGGDGEPQGGARDFLVTVHSMDEAHAWLAAHPQAWVEVWVWTGAGLELAWPKAETKKGKAKS